MRRFHFLPFGLMALSLVMVRCSGAESSLGSGTGADGGDSSSGSSSGSGGGSSSGGSSGSGGGSSSGGSSGSGSGSSSGGSSGSGSGSSSGGSSGSGSGGLPDAGSVLECGTAGVCTGDTYCRIDEGLHLLDGGLGTQYTCVAYPSTCTNTPTCKCITTVTAGCLCAQTTAGFTVTCQFP